MKNTKKNIILLIAVAAVLIAAVFGLNIQSVDEYYSGGTDGSKITYMGTPCPNFCTGGTNFHGRFETVSIQAMDKIVELIEKILTNYAEQSKK